MGILFKTPDSYKVIFIALSCLFSNAYAQLSSQVEGTYLCEYIIFKANNGEILESGTSKIWVYADGSNSINYIDTLTNRGTSNPSIQIHRGLQLPKHDTIIYSCVPNYSECSFFYAIDSINNIGTWVIGGKLHVYKQVGKRLPVSVSPLTYRSLKIYPQPAQHELFVSEMPQGKKTMYLHDLLGKVVWHKESLLESEVIDLSALQKGMYILEVQTENNRFTEKVLKE